MLVHGLKYIITKLVEISIIRNYYNQIKVLLVALPIIIVFLLRGFISSMITVGFHMFFSALLFRLICSFLYIGYHNKADNGITDSSIQWHDVIAILSLAIIGILSSMIFASIPYYKILLF